MQYLRNRYYMPGQGKFLTEDPIKSGMNWFSYCNGNPVSLVDPLGLAGEKITLQDIYALKAQVGSTITMAEYSTRTREMVASVMQSNGGGGSGGSDSYRHYIFFDPGCPEMTDGKDGIRNRLINMGIPDDRIRIIPVSERDDFTGADGWNGMGLENGGLVRIGNVYVYVHGNPTSLGSRNDATNKFIISRYYIERLDSKNIQMLFLGSCEVAGIAPNGSNVAETFAGRVNGAPVFASDGVTYGNRDYFYTNTGSWFLHQMQGGTINKTPVGGINDRGYNSLYYSDIYKMFGNPK